MGEVSKRYGGRERIRRRFQAFRAYRQMIEPEDRQDDEVSEWAGVKVERKKKKKKIKTMG